MLFLVYSPALSFDCLYRSRTSAETRPPTTSQHNIPISTPFPPRTCRAPLVGSQSPPAHRQIRQPHLITCGSIFRLSPPGCSAFSAALAHPYSRRHTLVSSCRTTARKTSPVLSHSSSLRARVMHFQLEPPPSPPAGNNKRPEAHNLIVASLDGEGPAVNVPVYEERVRVPARLGVREGPPLHHPDDIRAPPPALSSPCRHGIVQRQRCGAVP